MICRPSGFLANPESGEVLWSVLYEATSNSIIMSPIAFGKYLDAAGYSNKSGLLKYKDDFSGVDLVWQNQARDVEKSCVNLILWGLSAAFVVVVKPLVTRRQARGLAVNQQGDR